MKLCKLIVLIITFWVCFLYPQKIMRKAYFGIQTEAVTDTLANQSIVNGLKVISVQAGSTAEALQIKPGDIIYSINGNTVKLPSDISALKVFAGENIFIRVYREDDSLQLSGIAVERPKETSKNFSVIYTEVPYLQGAMRAIITKPTVGKHFPAVLFIQGYTCSPVCDLPEWHPYRKLTDGLTEAGFLVIRVEKPGVGETIDVPDCVQMDIFAETEAFKAAYQYMLQLPEVDTSKVFIWGHSMGGKIAPAIAAEKQPAGVVVYGTTHEYWSEYLFKMIRAQNVGFGTTTYAETEKDLAAYRTIFFRLCVEKKHPKYVASEDSLFAKLLQRDLQWDGGELIFGRSYMFFSSVEDMNTTIDLLAYNGGFLSMYGEGDVEVFEPNAMKRMTEIVNSIHPGNAEFVSIPETDHAFLKLGDLPTSFKIRADLDRYRKEMRVKFNPLVVSESVRWMNKVISKLGQK